jgi:hypothetical protein
LAVGTGRFCKRRENGRSAPRGRQQGSSDREQRRAPAAGLVRATRGARTASWPRRARAATGDAGRLLERGLRSDSIGRYRACSGRGSPGGRLSSRERRSRGSRSRSVVPSLPTAVAGSRACRARRGGGRGCDSGRGRGRGRWRRVPARRIEDGRAAGGDRRDRSASCVRADGASTPGRPSFGASDEASQPASHSDQAAPIGSRGEGGRLPDTGDGG